MPAAPKWEWLEQLLGARLSVWVGAAAIALGGGYLVKYSIDNNLVDPAVRVSLSGALGLALLGATEWVRKRAPWPAAGVAAAGVAVLYGTLFAANVLYALLPSWLGFVLLDTVTAAAVALSLRHGQIVAFIGLAGGLLTPVMVPSTDPSPWILCSYLATLQIGVAAVARHRDWPYLLGSSAAGGLLWAVAVILMVHLPQMGTPQWLYLAALFATYVAATGLPGWRRWPTASLRLRSLASAVVVIVILLGGWLLDREGHRLFGWVMLLVLVVTAGALDRFDNRYKWLSIPVVAVPLLVLLAWGLDQPTAMNWLHFARVGLGVGGVLAVAATAAAHGTTDRWRWFALSGLISTATLLALWYCLPASDLPWGYFCVGIAALYLLLLVLEIQAGRAGPGERVTLAAIVTFLLALAIPFELSKPWMPIAWSLQVLAMAWLERRFSLPPLSQRWGLVASIPVLRVLAAPLFIIAIMQLLSVAATGAPSLDGEMKLALWLFIGHGLPIAAFVATAAMYADRHDDLATRMLEWGAVITGGWLTLLVVRLGFHGNLSWQEKASFLEVATLANLWFMYALALGWVTRHWPRTVLVVGRLGFAVLAIFASLVVAHVGFSPLLEAESLGALPVLNGLLWTSVLPALLALALFWQQRLLPGDPNTAQLPMLLQGFALVMAIVATTLMVRHGFHPDNMSERGIGVAENYAYSVAWLGFGIALLLPGVLLRLALLRYAGLGVVVVAVAKVFLYDAANLEGLYRAASFVGQGLSLLGLGYVYQRYVRTTPAI